MNLRQSKWGIPGVIHLKGITLPVYLPAPLLCFNLPAWAKTRADALRRDSQDTDYSKSERQRWEKRADEIEGWLSHQRGTIAFETHGMLCFRSEAEPWVVNHSDLDEYIIHKILPLCQKYDDDTPPAFVLWSDAKEKILYVTNPALVTLAVECPSAEIPVKRITQEELYGVIGQLAASQAVAAHMLSDELFSVPSEDFMSLISKGVHAGL